MQEQTDAGPPSLPLRYQAEACLPTTLRELDYFTVWHTNKGEP